MKITGLGIDAALTGPDADRRTATDPELTDTRGLARLLYAALTGYWPGPYGDPDGADGPSGRTGLLPPAPQADGLPCTPRQVSAAVPANIDALTCQALFQRPSRHGPALSTPASSPTPWPAWPRPTRCRSAPRHAAPTATGTHGGYRPNGSTNPYPSRPPGGPGHGPAPAAGARPPASARPPSAPRRPRPSSAS